MAGMELAIKRDGKLNLRELAARTTLREIQHKGHVYVELRKVGKRTIFFCMLCLTPCFSDSVLFDHLGGSLHARRYDAAKVTLFGLVPWPFSDGVLFFGNSKGIFQSLVNSNSANGVLSVASDGGKVGNGDEVTSKGNGDEVTSKGNGYSVSRGDGRVHNNHGSKTPRSCNGANGNAANGNHLVTESNVKDKVLMIPKVLFKDELSSLEVKLVGFGHISSRVLETTNAVGSKISKIWCAWWGDGGAADNEVLLKSPKCDFAIVNFSYTYDLGRKWTLEDPKLLLSPGSWSEVDDVSSPRKREKRSFSDPESSSGAAINSCISSGEDCSGVDGGVIDGVGKQLHSRLSSSKALRRELRRQKRLAAERMCDICAQEMLPGKDVGTLLNLKTGNLACSSRNTNGAFHVFHISCLIHWILLCESEVWRYQPSNKKTPRRRKRKRGDKHIFSVLCPECQGTGINTVGDELEKPTISLSEIFLYKLKTIESQKAWMKNPEELKKCSTGLHFPPDSTECIQENVVPMKLLHFYRSDEVGGDLKDS